MLGLFRQPPATPRPRRSLLDVEALEERSVPAVFTVTNQSDHNPGSLRVAVQNANARLGHDTIRFAPAFDATITLTTGDINITDDLTIEGNGTGSTAVSGNNASRIFDLDEAAAPISVEISGLKLTGGLATGADGSDGGALYIGTNDVTLRNCTISGNRADSSGGAACVDGGSLTARNTIFANNRAADDGGALYLDNGRLTAANCKFLNNAAPGQGGAIALYNDDGPSVARLIGCTISGNTASGVGVAGGGGVFLDNQCALTVSDSTISQNTADYGGGIYSWGGIGGGSTARLTITNSTISGNRSNDGGGGLWLYNVETLIVQSTISGNVDRAALNPTFDGGGGLHLYGGNTVIRNSTIAFNSSASKGGGIFLRDSATQSARLLLTSTIVSNSTAPLGNFDVARPAAEGRVTAVRSLIQRMQPGFINNGSTANLIGVNPRLLPLADNGGPTRTHAFTAGSPARDAGSNPDQLMFDQRGPGFPRVKGGGVDVGSLDLF